MHIAQAAALYLISDGPGDDIAGRQLQSAIILGHKALTANGAA